MTNGMIACRLQILVAWGRLYLARKPLLPLSEFLQSLANGVVRQLPVHSRWCNTSDMGKSILFTEQWELIGELLLNGREMFFNNFRFILVRCFNPAILSSDACSVSCADPTASGILHQLPVRLTVVYLREQISVVFGFS